MIGFELGRKKAALAAAAVCAASGVAQAESRPPTITPFDHEKALFGSAGAEQHDNGGIASGPGIQAAAAHIIGQQCGNGGWSWPHAGLPGYVCPTTFSNITAPIGMGLLQAYALSGDPAILTSVTNGASHDLTFTFATGGVRFGSFEPAFLHALSGVTGNPSWSNVAATDFFDRLTADSYGNPAESAFYPANTYDYLARHASLRSGGQVNLRPWDMQLMPSVAAQIGNSDSAPADGISQHATFLNNILSNTNLLDAVQPGVNPAYFGELIGLTGTVRALALDGTTTFPAINAPLYPAIDGISDLCDLADVLAGFQNPNGSWYWTSNVFTASDEDTQTTAYAVLALIAAEQAGCGPYNAEIAAGRAYLRSIQDGDGGFPSYPGGPHNIEGESEALMAIAIPQTLSIEVSQTCFNTSPITVQVWARDLVDAVHGYQAFIEYDNTKLAFVGGSSSYTASPFGSHIGLISAAETSPGEISLNGTTGTGAPPYPAGSPDVQLATLVFTVISECDDTSVDFDLDEVFDSEFSLAGEVLPTALSNSGDFYADLTDPAITCPDNIVVNADAGGCTAVLNPPIPQPTIIGGLASVVNAGSPHGNVVSLCSDLSNGEFGFASHTLGTPFPFNSLSTLSMDYNPQAGCWGCGSPRISVRVDHDNNGIISSGDRSIFVYLGTHPNFTDCESIGAWANTGNFVTDPTLRWDSTQVGGPFYGDYLAAAALIGPKLVLRVSVVTDGGNGGCGSGGHCLWIDNLQVNSTTLTYNDSFIASDSCTTPTVTGVRSDSQPLNAAYQSGTTTITWTATDECGNSSSCFQTVTVNPVNDVNVAIHVPDSTGILNARCFHFVVNDCDVVADATLNIVGGLATGTVQIPCGNWTSLCIKDEQHTLWGTATLTDAGTQYNASSVILDSGDTDNDGDVDIHDVTWLLFTWSQPQAFGDCPWDGTRDADFSNNNNVGAEDYASLAANWLEFTTCGCTDLVVEPNQIAIETKKLHPDIAARVDRNRDGMFNWKDVKDFERAHGLPSTLSRKMTPTTAASGAH